MEPKPVAQRSNNWRFHKSLRDAKREAAAGLEFYAKLSGKPTPPELITADLAKPRKYKPQGAHGRPLEKNIRAAVVKALRAHPLVASVSVNFSGNMGGYYIGIRGKGDLSVKLRNGRWGEIELKVPGRKPTPVQLNRLEHVRRIGGFAGWAVSVEEAVRIVEAAL
jgi:hypothetical protein